MPKHESFLLRVDPAILAALKRWAADELRSANGQIEFLLRKALQEAHRLPKATDLPENCADSPTASNDVKL